jgi:adenosine kinase
MTNRIAVTGSIAYDFLSQYDKAFEDVLMKDQLHQLSVCFVVANKERHFGGTAGNIAYSLALLKDPPTIFAGVGYDFADYAKRLKKLKVDISPIRVTKHLPTASATIITDENENQISEFCIGAMGNGLKPHTQSLDSAELLIIAPDDPDWMMEYVRLAKHFELPYFFDPGQGLPRFNEPELVEALSGSEGVFVNDYELELMKKIMDRSLDKLRQYTKTLVVTHGDQGSTIYSEDGVHAIPAVKTDNAINPTGCGDAYRAGFLHGYVEGRSIDVCGRMGALLGLYVVERTGTQIHSFKAKEFRKRYKSEFKEAL